VVTNVLGECIASIFRVEDSFALFYPENGGKTFLQNRYPPVGLHSIATQKIKIHY
jgi:hypothetical protein